MQLQSSYNDICYIICQILISTCLLVLLTFVPPSSVLVCFNWHAITKSMSDYKL